MKCCLPGRLVRDPVPRVFTDRWRCEHHMPSWSPAPGSWWEGRCSASMLSSAQFRHREGYQFRWCDTSEAQGPRHWSWQALLQSFLKIKGSGQRCQFFFCTMGKGALREEIWQITVPTSIQQTLGPSVIPHTNSRNSPTSLLCC